MPWYTLAVRSLSGRLKLLTLIWVAAAMLSIVFTLVLSWQLEGGGAAINDAGSLRMQTYRLAFLVAEQTPQPELARQFAKFEHTIDTLQHGDPARPLFLPNDAAVKAKMQAIKTRWQQHTKPLLQSGAIHNRTITAQEHIRVFVGDIDELVQMVERDNTGKTNLLRLFQSMLLAMVLIGAGVMIVLLYLWVIRPLAELQNGVAAIRSGDFGVQMRPDNTAEFNNLANGFNQMSSHLADLYQNLEAQVAEKTQDLAEKNHELDTLYQTTSFLHQAHASKEMAAGFLQQIVPVFQAAAASIRLIDPQRGRMDLIAEQGLPEHLKSAEQCERLAACFCGEAAQTSGNIPILPLQGDSNDPQQNHLCARSGFRHLAVFHIEHKHQPLGILNLYFGQAPAIKPQDEALLHTLCAQLGVALTNIRLAQESQQLAVLQERNLMAQGLHDSIAQTLTFLNLQVQMLDSALAAQETAQIDENLNFIKEGVQECYDDVRELLLNFRTKITQKDFPEAIATLVKRFEHQTQISTEVSWQGHGLPLTPAQQLQVVFIVQESLSNIRKHAHASRVTIDIHNRQDFELSIRDNGSGFDAERMTAQGGDHVGMHIMRERARRIGAHIQIDSTPHQGTTITLRLPETEREHP